MQPFSFCRKSYIVALEFAAYTQPLTVIYNKYFTFIYKIKAHAQIYIYAWTLITDKQTIPAYHFCYYELKIVFFVRAKDYQKDNLNLLQNKAQNLKNCYTI